MHRPCKKTSRGYHSGYHAIGDKKAGQRPWQQEGLANQEWVILDYIDVVVHVFHSDKRAFYALDTLWGDAVITHISN